MTSTWRLPGVVLLVVTGLMVAGPAAAQTAMPRVAETPSTPPGWTATPAAAVAVLWDDNVSLTGDDGSRLEDLVTAVTPSVALGYRGRRAQLSLSYNVTFDLHRELSAFDTTDHRARLEFDRRLSRRVNAFARNSFTLSPTTELPTGDSGLLVLRRRTTRFNDFRGGVEIGTDARTSLTAAYASQWVSLANDEELQPLLRGGFSHGGDATLRRRINERTSVGGAYRLQHAIVSDGEEAFDIQNASALVAVRLSRTLNLEASAGYAWLLAGRNQDSRSAPAFAGVLTYVRERTSWEVGFARSYIPSFGFGGAVQNRELRGTLRVPVSRRLQLLGSASARENESLDARATHLRSFSAQASALVTISSWLHLEVFTQHVLQDAQRPGGRIGRTRAGVRLATLTTTRLR